LGAAFAMVAWIVVARARRGKVSSIGAATGAVAGLAAITPASGFVPAWGAMVIGLGAGVLCYGAVSLKNRFRYDDSLDVVGVHMVGGMLGVVLTGAFASQVINAAGPSASFALVGKQAALALVTVVYSFLMTLVLLRVADRTMGVRVSDEHEALGLDASQHGEVPYLWGEGETASG
jgi:Amt family ammonium transporter